MERSQIYLNKNDKEDLKSLAKKEGISMAEYIRRIILIHLNSLKN